MTDLKFPDDQEERARRCAEFQKLSSDERFRQIFALCAFGWSMIHASPRRAEIEARMREEEAELRRIYQELFARHGV